jgi:DHA1 family bicyclomycin/chloramphenicol resistance-like MFS transporter
MQASYRGLAHRASDRAFMLFMLATLAFSALPFMAYLTAAPYVYEGYYGLSPQVYSYVFGATAALSVLGIPLYRLAAKKMSLGRLTTLIIVMAALSGLAIVLFGNLAVGAFFLPMLVLYILGTMIRPYSTGILLSMCGTEAGAAGSLMNCSYTLLGVLGSLPLLIAGGEYILLLGVLMIAGSLISATIWFFLLRSKLEVPGINTPPDR